MKKEERKKSENANKEELVLEYWQENKIFEKSLEKDSPKGEYVFYEGPPTANGKPGIHHLGARAFKDAISRYKTMKGYSVPRKGGWDTHGLPVEIQAEKKLNLQSKRDIEEYGIDKFNQECKKSVWEYTDLWSKFTDRIGFWIDQEDPYVTYHNKYIESVWNIIKEADNQNLLYKDYKIVPWCPRCETGLSSHELAQGYEDVKDLTTYVKFKLKDNLYVLVWTTTPWTLPSNVALAVGEKIDYVKVKQKEEFLILAKNRLSVLGDEYEIEEEIKGQDLIGLTYEPLFPYIKNLINDEEKPKLENSYKIYGGSFVNTEDGTGIVHLAPMYGQDDFEIGDEVGLPKYHLVGLDGKFIKETGYLSGRFARDEDLAVDIIKDLAERNLLCKKEKVEHSYPHCWRCKTALIYYARESWYIKMSALKEKMIKENEGINWEPRHIKEGRFGGWLKEVKDWAISRERYWGTPLPVWECKDCYKKEVLGSLGEIKNRTKRSNNYFLMRHGEAENNTEEIITAENSKFKLTESGRQQVEDSINNANLGKIDIIISSPFTRAKETAEIVSQKIGYKTEDIIYDERVREWEVSSIFEGKEREGLIRYYSTDYLDNTGEALPGSESFQSLVKRLGDFIYDIENKYKDKNILIVGHFCAFKALSFVAKGLTFEELSRENDPLLGLKNAEIEELDFSVLPHNDNYELDLHRPYIDNIDLKCDCGGELERNKEVMDVWLDSGAMPFAQSHYPFSQKELSYPADFISEGLDQTRGWFYTLHAVGNIMNKGKAFKNVICLGLLLDSQGKKMSKSVGNVVDPWEMIDKYGVDTLRLWMYSVNQPGESKNFDEKTIAELNSKFFNLLYNVLSFYELYRDKNVENNEKIKSNNLLDIWILSRLSELTKEVTENLDKYKLLEPARAIRLFIDDLSTWYLRRSRERIKEEDREAKKTLYYVLKELSKLMAPLTPFASEHIWLKLKLKEDPDSVHLTNWPEINTIEKEVIEKMKELREAVSLGLQFRQKASIPVRQPLSEIIIKKYKFEKEYIDIAKEELNIKEVVFEDGKDLEVEINTTLTEELREEGNYRELIRFIQEIRKKNKLNPNDIISLEVQTEEKGKQLIDKFRDSLLKAVVAENIEFKNCEGDETKVGDLVFTVSIKVKE